MNDASETVYVFRCATCGGPAAHDTEDHDRLTENPCDGHVHGPLTTNERILAASLADARARLAAVEALADDWEQPRDDANRTGPRADCRVLAARQLRAALRAEPARGDPSSEQ
jgi:hypothetical protein